MKLYLYIFFYFILLLCIGSVFVYSASSFIGEYYYHNTFVFYSKQMIAVFLAIIISFIISQTPIVMIRKYTFFLFFFIFFLNILPFSPFFSHPINGARRWINFFGIIFQPSELLKFAYFLQISSIFHFYFDQIQYALSMILFYFLLVVFILMNQSDFGLIMIFSFITFILLWNFLYRKIILVYAFIFLILLLIGLIIMKPYRILRFMSFLNPWDDPLGKGFQIIQSFIAIQNGGIMGLGLGNSKQKNLFLPMVHTDFIFSIMIEEVGLIFSFVVIYLLFRFSFFFIAIRKYIIHTFDNNYLLCTGLLIIIQTIINISSAIGLLPTKGLGLPFISYGMSSLIGFAFLVGIALSAIKNSNK